MALSMTFSKNAEGTFDVKLSGGSPWGFTLQGGSEFHSKLCVSKLTPGGKADSSEAFALGDEIVAINGIECTSRAEAIELVRCSRQKLRITLRRIGAVPPNAFVPEQNGPPSGVSDPVPNLYKTALELNSSDFYSTYNVDREQYSKVMQSQPLKRKPVYDSTDNLSASHEDLLASYRGVGVENTGTAGVGQHPPTRSFPPEMANGRTSPETHGLSGVSLPEGQHWQFSHSRTYTSPARIQKVTVTSKNISGPDHMPSGTPGERSPSGLGAMPVRSKSATPPKPGRDPSPDWVQNWLRQDNPAPAGSVSVAAARAKFEAGAERSKQVAREDELKREYEHDNHVTPSSGQGNPTRSKSFAGIPSYGMKVTATSVRGRKSVQEESRPILSASNNSSSLPRSSPLVLEPRHMSTGSLPVEMPFHDLSHVVGPTHDAGQMRFHRDVAPRPYMGGSTSNIDQLDETAGSSTGSLGSSRRQCPAPPPRRSTSKLLSSFRSRGKRVPAHFFPPSPAAVIPEPDTDATSDSSAAKLAVPHHAPSKSWPTEHEVKTTPTDNRQSWHAEAPPRDVMATARREGSFSGSSTGGHPERKNSKSGQWYSSSVVIRPKRTSSSSSNDERATQTYYVRPAVLQKESEPGRIEDTQILIRLMKDQENVGSRAAAKPTVSTPEQRAGAHDRSCSLSELPREQRVAQRSFGDTVLSDTRRSTESDVAETITKRALAEPAPTNKGPASIRVSPRIRSPSGPERPRKAEAVSVAVVSPTSSGGNPQLKTQEAPIVEVEQQQQEKVVELENIFQRMNREPVTPAKEPVNDIVDIPPPPSVGNDDVFVEDDDPLPPPPPEADLAECPKDNLPMPSPPEEVLRNTQLERKHSPFGGDILPEKHGAEQSHVSRGVEEENAKNLPVEEEVGAVETDIDLASPEPETRDGDVGGQRASPPPPLVITSTPTSNHSPEVDGSADNYASPVNSGSTLSTPGGSRPNSMLSPKLEALDKEKAGLVGSMEKKISDLRSQMQEIDEEIKANEELGEKVTKVVEKKATSTSEFSKYQLFTGELNKIIGLLLSLTQRMHRYEMMLQDLDMSEEADRLRRDVLLEKIDKVKMQYEEACKIKEVNDKRGEVVSKFLENYLHEEEFADFQYYIDMKTQLALMHAEIRDKVKMGEERLNALTHTEIDWSVLSLNS